MSAGDKHMLCEAFHDTKTPDTLPMSGSAMRDLIALVAAMALDEKLLLVQAITSASPS